MQAKTEKGQTDWYFFFPPLMSIQSSVFFFRVTSAIQEHNVKLVLSESWSGANRVTRMSCIMVFATLVVYAPSIPEARISADILDPDENTSVILAFTTSFVLGFIAGKVSIYSICHGVQTILSFFTIDISTNLFVFWFCLWKACSNGLQGLHFSIWRYTFRSVRHPEIESRDIYLKYETKIYPFERWGNFS